MLMRNSPRLLLLHWLSESIMAFFLSVQKPAWLSIGTLEYAFDGTLVRFDPAYKTIHGVVRFWKDDRGIDTPTSVTVAIALTKQGEEFVYWLL